MSKEITQEQIDGILEKVILLKEQALASKGKKKKTETIQTFEGCLNVVRLKHEDAEGEYAKQLSSVISFLEDSIEEVREAMTVKGKLKVFGSWFKDQYEKHKPVSEKFNEKDMIEELNEEPRHFKLTKKSIAAGTVALAVVIGIGASGYGIYKYKENKKEKEIAKIAAEWENQSFPDVPNKANEIGEAQELKEVKTQEEKEAEILALSTEIKEKFNKFDGLNVTTEQTLALFIHFNVGNSYMNEKDTLALDKITRENLIKTYFVGLTPGTEEFDTYVITDDDLAKVSTNVMEIRNALANRIIVLNDEGKYVESRQIIDILKLFVTQENLKDEMNVLTNSIKGMQTSDIDKLKEEVYRYYNYIFAGPKSDVRNFDGYAPYLDGDKKEMTYENQGMTMRFATWFMDTFVDINISGKNLIPQDIINSKEAKLMDMSNLLRAMGFKNCNAFDTYYVDFETPIDNKGKKGSTSGRKTGTGTAVTPATGDPKLDQEIDAGLKNNAEVGSSFTTGDGSTVTVIESGPSSTTIEVAPDPGSAVVEDTTPPGSNSSTVIEGGGNETVDEIHFEEDPTEVIIQEGGDVIQSSGTPVEESHEETPVETYEAEPASEPAVEVEEMTFEEDTVASIRDEINALLFVRQIFAGETFTDNGYVYIAPEIEEPYEKTLSC